MTPPNASVGHIPYRIGKLKQLTVLNLEGNSLAGTIPGSIGDLSTLEALNLAHNSLRGGCSALYVLSSTTISKLIMFLLLQGAFRRAWGA